jgi:hypothetical protein
VPFLGIKAFIDKSQERIRKYAYFRNLIQNENPPKALFFKGLSLIAG